MDPPDVGVCTIVTKLRFATLDEQLDKSFDRVNNQGSSQIKDDLGDCKAQARGVMGKADELPSFLGLQTIRQKLRAISE